MLRRKCWNQERGPEISHSEKPLKLANPEGQGSREQECQHQGAASTKAVHREFTLDGGLCVQGDLVQCVAVVDLPVASGATLVTQLSNRRRQTFMAE